ncbi:right-handed parallel beta-helix repeat-containing protein, partial [Planctomycetota bacterium]
MLKQVALLLSLSIIASWGLDIPVSPGMDVQDIIENVMTDSDDVIFSAGTYTLDHFRLNGRHGTSGDYITIRAAAGAAVVLDGNSSYNMIDISDSSYIHIKGFEILDSSDGIKFNTGTSSYIIIEDCYIHNIDGVGISSQADLTSFVTVKNCRITYSPTCGFYLGSEDGTNIVHDWLITNCYIAYCGGVPDSRYGYGIEIKKNSYANIIEDSVWHHVAGTSRAGIAVYSTGKGSTDRNIVRRNAVWNVPRNGSVADGTPGIWSNAEALIENNIVFDSGRGFHCNEKDANPITNLTVRNNTFYNAHSDGLLGGTGSGNTAANNAAYACGTNIDLKTGWIDISNFSGTGAGVFASTSFGHASFLYPAAASVLKDAGDNAYMAGEDFNMTARPFNATVDVGAYEWTQAGNPGWTISNELTDADGDGMDDTWEGNKGLNNSDPDDGDDDPDGDGAVNLLEFLAGTEPFTPDFDADTDTDGDGMPDLWEFDQFGNLNQSGGGDADGDDFTNKQEYDAGTDPMDAASQPASSKGSSSAGGCSPSLDGWGWLLGILIAAILIKRSSCLSRSDTESPVT